MGRCTKSRSKKNYSHKRKYHGKTKRECDENNKTDLQVHNFVNKNNFQDTEVSTKITSLSTATACSSKIIETEIDPSVPTTASSQISGYRLINMSILADVFILLSGPGCDSIIVLNFVTLIKKRKVWQDICNSAELFTYVATRFSPRSRLIYRRKTKEDKNFMM